MVGEVCNGGGWDFVPKVSKLTCYTSVMGGFPPLFIQDVATPTPTRLTNASHHTSKMSCTSAKIALTHLNYNCQVWVLSNWVEK
jgi:hypothetical protein